MILRWHFDGNHSRLWWNTMQIWFLSNGSYSLKNCHNPFGKAIHPPPPYGKIPVEHWKSLRGASLTQSCCGFFDMNVKKCVNVRLDKIWRNSAKICGQNVKFTLKFYPWKYFFVPILCCQKASRMIQTRNINFYTWVWSPPLYTMCKNSSDLAEDGFPKR